MSSKPWTPDIPFDAALAKRVVINQFPEFRGVEPTLIGEGWDNSVWRFGETSFRFPHREVGVQFLERERDLLPWIAPQVPKPVPFAKYRGEPSEAFPRPFIGADFIAGTPPEKLTLNDADRAKIAAPLGVFLAALHGIDQDHAQSLGAQPFHRGNDFEKWMKWNLIRCDELSTTDYAWIADLTLPFLDAATPWPDDLPAFVVHGDLYFRHILISDAGDLAGVIDWGDVALGDRAGDFEMLYGFFPPSARQSFIDAYEAAGGDPIDTATLERARLIAVTTTLNLAAYAIDIGNKDILREIEATARWAEVE